MKYIVLTAIFEPEGGYYNAVCRELGVASFGKSLQEAFQNLREATEEYLNTLNEYGEAFEALRSKGIGLLNYRKSKANSSLPKRCSRRL